MNKIIVTLYIFFTWSILPVYGQRSKKSEIVTERHLNGLKALVLVFEGEGLNEILVAKYGFFDNGLKSFIESYNNNQKDGKCLYWYSDGNQAKEVFYKDNKRDGQYKEWYQDGNKYIVANYIDDKRNGNYEEWYDDGNKYIFTNYVNDKRDGQYKEWYQDGKKYVVANYVNDKRDGNYAEWNYDGELIKKGNYNGNLKHGTWTVKNKDGTKFTSIYKNDILNGKATSFYANGNKSQEGVYKDGDKHNAWLFFNEDGTKNYEWVFPDDLCTTFHNNGKKEKYGLVKNRQWEGLVTEWDETGKKISEGNYVNGKLEGLRTIWGETGMRILSTYIRGELNGKIEIWYGNGTKKMEGYYENDQKNGLFSYYNLDGKIEKEIDFYENVINDSTQWTYHDNGNISTKEINFSDGSKIYNSWHNNGSMHMEKNYNRLGEEYGKRIAYNEDGSMEIGKYMIWKDSMTMYDAIRLGFWQPTEKEKTVYEKIKKEKKIEEKRIREEERLALQTKLEGVRENISRLNKKIDSLLISQNKIFNDTKEYFEDQAFKIYNDYQSALKKRIDKWNNLNKKDKKKWSKKNKKHTPSLVAFGENVVSEELFYLVKKIRRISDKDDLLKHLKFLESMSLNKRKVRRDWESNQNPKKKIKTNPSLKGQVVSERGNPIRAAIITLYQIGSIQNHSKTYKTKLDGNFNFQKCSNAAYRLDINSGNQSQRKYVIMNNDVNLGKINLVYNREDILRHNFLLMSSIIDYVSPMKLELEHGEIVDDLLYIYERNILGEWYGLNKSMESINNERDEMMNTIVDYERKLSELKKEDRIENN